MKSIKPGYYRTLDGGLAYVGAVVPDEIRLVGRDFTRDGVIGWIQCNADTEWTLHTWNRSGRYFSFSDSDHPTDLAEPLPEMPAAELAELLSKKKK